MRHGLGLELKLLKITHLRNEKVPDTKVAALRLVRRT
jgi:hypothetical protein